MTSVVTDILNSAGVLTKEDITLKVESLGQKIEDVKLEIQESLKSCYVDFIPKYARLEKLAGDLDDVKNEYESLHYHVEKEIRPQMNTSVSEYHELSEEMKRIQSLKQVVSCLTDMHRCVENARYALDKKRFLIAIENLLKFEEKADHLHIDDNKDIEIYCAMKMKYCAMKQNVIYRLGEEWKKIIIFPERIDMDRYPKKYTLIFDLEQMEGLGKVVESLKALDELESRLRLFGKQFMDSICIHLIWETSELNVTRTIEDMTFVVTVMGESCPVPDKVCKNLMKLFKNLNKLFLEWESEKSDSESELGVMHILGRCIGRELCEKLIEKSLKPSVPKKSKDLKSFQVNIASVKSLEEFFCDIGFVEREDNPIHHFIANVDQLPASKMAVDLLSQARDLMKQDLHYTVRVGTTEMTQPSIVDFAPTPSPTEELQGVSSLKSSGLSKNTFAFPSCQISKSAKELVELLHQVLKEAKALESNSPNYSSKLFYTARSICELYCCVVPSHHKDKITSLPQQTAIFHNNCMYIAHCLLNLGQAHHRVKFPYLATFIDLVPELRRLGTESFLAQMRTQRQNLLQLLQEPTAFRNMSQDEEMVSKAEKTVRQCLCQLELLKRVWSDTLPIEVYFKAIGTLLNTFMEEIIMLLTSMEDIAAQVSAQFDNILGIVLKKSPELFKVDCYDKRDFVHKYVRRWFKFQELQLVLNASLIEIVERWASGKGPLAAHFTADEIKHLIRALFQNTERRAAALGKIR